LDKLPSPKRPYLAVTVKKIPPPRARSFVISFSSSFVRRKSETRQHEETTEQNGEGGT